MRFIVLILVCWVLFGCDYSEATQLENCDDSFAQMKELPEEPPQTEEEEVFETWGSSKKCVEDNHGLSTCVYDNEFGVTAEHVYNLTVTALQLWKDYSGDDRDHSQCASADTVWLDRNLHADYCSTGASGCFARQPSRGYDDGNNFYIRIMTDKITNYDGSINNLLLSHEIWHTVLSCGYEGDKIHHRIEEVYPTTEDLQTRNTESLVLQTIIEAGYELPPHW